MSERKAINKWYPPDYDPSKVPKKSKTQSKGRDRVRLMLPFSMKCLKCNEFISARRKFNATKEATSEKYMGFKIIKFHVRCPCCNNGIVFRTDPALAGFVPVEGGVRNYESLAREHPKINRMETDEEILSRLEKEEEASRQFKEQQEMRKRNPFWQRTGNSNDAMKNLENKLAKQQEEQQMYDHLVQLQDKASRLQESGGLDRLVQDAQNKLREEMAKKREFGDANFDSIEEARKTADTLVSPAVTMSKVITVKKPKKMTETHQPSQPKFRSNDNDIQHDTNLTPEPTKSGLSSLLGYAGSDDDDNN